MKMENFETVTLRVPFQYAHKDQIEDAEFEMVKDQPELPTEITTQ